MANSAATGRRRADEREVIRLLAAEMIVEHEALAAGMAAYLHELIPELGDAELELIDETTASCDSNIVQILTLLEHEAGAESLIMPLEASAFVRGLVRRGIALAVVLRSYRLGHQWLWEIWSERLHARLDDAGTLAATLEASSSFLFQYVDRMADGLVEEYGAERDRLVRSAVAVRSETVRDVLAGDLLDEEVASRRLGYELRRHHVALRLSADPGVGEGLTGLERAAEEATSALGPGQPLIVPTGAAIVRVWWSGREEPREDRLLALERYVAPEGVRVAIGRPGFGIEGFRRSSEEANEAARIGTLGADGGEGVVSYRSVELTSLLAADFDRARRFVRHELGELAGTDESTGRLRETVLTFLSRGASNVRAARALHVHQNTIVYRVNRAEELLGRPVTERQPELICALTLVAVLGEPVLRP
ncbi:MAG: helix-turn-helix domain-containing protein [Thermoleophilaceae bacterium]|nr:helix-turn-helix domain-containing protein [Thermoleophilaceae bacterium]